MPGTPPRLASRRPLGLLVAATLAATLLLGTTAAPAGAATPTAASLASELISRINAERTERGLVRYRTDSRLTALATERAGNMAAKGVLSHAAAGGSLSTVLNNRGIQWYGYGEAIGMTGYAWGTDAVRHLVRMWMGSSGHRALLLSRDFNYVGAGVAYRSSNRTTWASLVFTESRDRTPPKAYSEGIGASGTTVTVAWSGHDIRLQTHTAGLRSFDVQYRVDDGAWTTIRDDTTSTSLTLRDRARGHWYGFRVQAADRRGNLSTWTSEQRVWVR